MKKHMRKIIALVLSLTLLTTGTLTAFAASADTTPSNIKIEVVSKDKGGEIKKVENNGKVLYVATKEEETKLNSYDRASEQEMIDTLSDNMKAKLAENQKVDKQTGKKVKFGFSDTLEDAKNILNDINNTQTQTTEVSAQLRGYFWHGSYVEDYWGYAGHGYHIKLAPVDVSYITNLGWIAGDSVVAALVAVGVITGGWGIVIGGIVTAAVVTWSWYEQNSDGSIDIWTPDMFRSTTRGGSYVQVGRHWYWL